MAVDFSDEQTSMPKEFLGHWSEIDDQAWDGDLVTMTVTPHSISFRYNHHGINSYSCKLTSIQSHELVGAQDPTDAVKITMKCSEPDQKPTEETLTLSTLWNKIPVLIENDGQGTAIIYGRK